MLLDGKVAIVSGSTRGLGRGFTEALAAEGAQVVVNGTNEALVAEVVKGKVNGLWPVAVTDMTRVLVERKKQQAADDHRDQKSARELGLGQIAEVAPLAVYLASDLCDLNGQILTSNGTKLALWSHPDEVVTVDGENWTRESINNAVTAQFTPFRQTVGMDLV